MENSATLKFVIATFAVAILIFACGKKQAPAPEKFSGCRVRQIMKLGADTTGNNKLIYTFSYNGDGTVSKIVCVNPATANDSSFTIFYYKGKYIISYTVFYNELSAPASRDSIILDSQNRVSFVDHHDYNGSPPPNVNWEKFTYDVSGQMIYHTSHYYSQESVDTFLWQDGDIQHFSADIHGGWGAIIYDYIYTDTVFSTGNITARIDDYTAYGRPTYFTKHLRRWALNESSPGTYDTIRYDYSLNATGEVTNIRETDPGNYHFITRIYYECE